MTKKTEAFLWDELVAKGKEAGKRQDLAYSAENFAEAYNVSQTFRNEDARRGESAYFLAFTRYLQGKKIEAAQLLQEYLVYPADKTGGLDRRAHVHTLLGSIFFSLDDLDAAEQHIRESLELERSLSGESWENHQFLASILMMQKKYKEAIPHLTFLFEHQSGANVEEAQKVAAMLAFVHKQLGDEQSEIGWQKKNLGIREALNPPPQPLPFPPAPELPEGWGLDALSHFLEACRRNEIATFVHKPELYKELSSLNDRYNENKKNLVLALTKEISKRQKNVEFSQIELEPEEWLEMYFFLRCQASYSGAIRLAMSGQVPEAFTLIRACFENALYAWHVSTSANLKRVWLDRHSNKKAADLVRDEFAIGKILRKLTAKSDLIGRVAGASYGQTIDEGAHPNVAAFLKSAAQKNVDHSLTLSVAVLNPDQTEFALQKVLDAGRIALDIFRLIYPNLID